MPSGVNQQIGIHSIKYGEHSNVQAKQQANAAQVGQFLGFLGGLAGSTAAAVTGTSPLVNAIGTSVSAIAGAAGAVGGGGAGAIDPRFGSMESLINKQIAVQTQMQGISMRSNIAKSDHESRMASIRNMKAA